MDTQPTPQLDPATRLARDGAEGLLAEALATADVHLVSTTLRSIHDRPGSSTSHVHESVVEVAGERQSWLLVAHVDRRAAPPGTLVLESDGVEVAVWRFPNDPWLPGLPSTLDPVRVRELLDGLGVDGGVPRLHTRAYRPTRRAVVEVGIDQPSGRGRVLYCKVMAGRRAIRVAAIHRALQDLVPVPGVVGIDRDKGILALEAVPGRTLRVVLVDDEPLPDPAELVATATAIAAADLPAGRDPRRFADPVRHVDGLATLVPHMAEEVHRIADLASTVEGPVVPVHGDLHDGQVLVTNGRITGLLDVDGTGHGLQAHDAGSMVAHVEAIGLAWPSAAPRARTYARALADEWRPIVGARDLAAATAGAWIGLATGPHRAQDTGWLAATEARIERAGQVLDGG